LEENGSNYILDVLKYEKQLDGYSCGFYVISAMSHFSYSLGSLTSFSYLPELTECWRKSAVIAFFDRVKDVYKIKGRRMTDLDVILHIKNERIRFLLPKGTEALRFDKDDSIEKFGEWVEDVGGYIDKLKEKSEFFNYRREFMPKNKEFSKRRMYTCFKERKGCKATVVARMYPSKGTWLVTKSGVHSHGAQAPKSTRK